MQEPTTPTSSPQGTPTTEGSLSYYLREALRFLLPLSSRPLSPECSFDSLGISRQRHIVPYVVPIGLAIGLIWAGSFRFGWWLFGETASMRVIPSLIVVLIECLLTGPFLAMGLARTIHILATDQPRISEPGSAQFLSPIGTLVLCLTVLCEYVLILSIPHREGWWPALNDWRSHFNFMYPRPIFRPLLLAPIWGRWGILLAATVGPSARSADQATRDLNGAMSPGRLLKHALLPLFLTVIYCSRSRNYMTGALIAVCVFAATYLISMAMARRGGGQSRQSCFAAGQIAQLAFLAIYRACWRLIDA